MSTADGNVVGMAKIVDHGPNSARYNIVILGDGYRTAELAKFEADALTFVNTLQATAPYTTLWPGINVFRVDVASTDSGASDPGAGVALHTYFDSRFQALSRLLTCNVTTALAAAEQQVPEHHLTMVIVNTATYGGSGGGAAVFSTHALSAQIALHEMGHTAFHLADEYEFYVGCTPPEADHAAFGSQGEPTEPNVTTRLASIKWANELTLAGDTLPTMANADCSRCDAQPSPKPRTYVGAFEGARYFHCGCYRPAFDCRMRTLGREFCGACQQIISTMLAPCLP
jgi:hypothetical protein